MFFLHVWIYNGVETTFDFGESIYVSRHFIQVGFSLSNIQMDLIRDFNLVKSIKERQKRWTLECLKRLIRDLANHSKIVNRQCVKSKSNHIKIQFNKVKKEMHPFSLSTKPLFIVRNKSSVKIGSLILSSSKETKWT